MTADKPKLQLEEQKQTKKQAFIAPEKKQPSTTKNSSSAQVEFKPIKKQQPKPAQ